MYLETATELQNHMTFFIGKDEWNQWWIKYGVSRATVPGSPQKGPAKTNSY